MRRSDIYDSMRIESDLLIDLIGTVPESDQANIQELLDGYATLMAALVD